MSGVHARLSASSAHRWLRCAGSVNASKGLDSTSAAAAQGTFAHAIAAQCLADPSLSPSDFLCKREKVDGFDAECDLEMVDGVRVYLDAVDDDMKEGDQGWIEMPLTDELVRIDPDLGGTADYVRYRPAARSLRTYDFKYGAGVYVDAEDNKQQRVYALGVLLKVKAPVDEVEVTIVQPRFEGANPVRSWKFKAVDLLAFADQIITAAEATRRPGAPLVAGSHCKFCPAARTCPELEKQQHALMAAEFAVVDPAALERLAVALTAIPQVKERIKAIEEFAYAEALKGAEIPGFKLVDKRPTRKWKSEGDVIEWAQKNAVDPYAPREVLSPAQLADRLAETAARGKKAAAKKLVDPFVEKVSSGTALVPASDERPPAKRITSDEFAVVEGTASKTEVSPLSSIF